MKTYVTLHSLESDCNDWNFSNMEYKPNKYIWDQQLTGFSDSYLSINTAVNAHSHTVAKDSYHLMEEVTFNHAGHPSAWYGRPISLVDQCDEQQQKKILKSL